MTFAASTMVMDEHRGTYLFTCPVCKRSVNKDMTEDQRQQLVDGGVHTTDYRIAKFEQDLEDEERLWQELELRSGGQH